jgi:FtsP/CotA-like multicopper oxidase with cupredoxin domain
MNSRRNFLVNGAALTCVGILSGVASAQDAHAKHGDKPSPTDENAKHGSEYDHSKMKMVGPKPTTQDVEYPRDRPGVGGPIGSPTDRGKLVPGLRDPSLGILPIQAPDLERLDPRIVDGIKVFHLSAEPVRRELLPGLWMDTYGYNGGMPGPTIEINQGDRVRIVVQNKLPEATSMHWHGLEVPVNMDGVPHLVQDLIEPGQSYTYEFTVHQEGTFFYHSHVGMQETMGMVGLFIVHPKTSHSPVVDRDFCLIAQEFQLRPNSTVPDTLAMEWNYLTFNGRCGPYTTPMLCKLGERVRMRFVNFSVIDHHPLHLHGHTFWITGTEGGRIPEPAWIPSNNVLVGVAQVKEIEFIANNPGDWVIHCHMFHHMMNSMTSQAGPIVRGYSTREQLRVKGYPQNMLGMTMAGSGHGSMNHGSMKMNSSNANPNPYAMDMSDMGMIEGRRPAAGMRPGWSMGIEGLTTVLRVLPSDVFEKITTTNEPISYTQGSSHQSHGSKTPDHSGHNMPMKKK